MSRLLLLKHWQLFVLLFALPSAWWLLEATALIFGPSQVHISAGTVLTLIQLYLVLVTVLLSFFTVWQLALARSLSPWDTGNRQLLYVSMCIPVACLLLLAIIIAAKGYESNIHVVYTMAMLFSVLRILAIVAYGYTMYRLAKALKTAESGSRPVFSDFAGDFLLFCIFPAGVWVLQPRIQALLLREKQKDTVSE